MVDCSEKHSPGLDQAAGDDRSTDDAAPALPSTTADPAFAGTGADPGFGAARAAAGAVDGVVTIPPEVVTSTTAATGDAPAAVAAVPAVVANELPPAPAPDPVPVPGPGGDPGSFEPQATGPAASEAPAR